MGHDDGDNGSEPEGRAEMVAKLRSERRDRRITVVRLSKMSIIDNICIFMNTRSAIAIRKAPKQAEERCDF
jgi:hypothetical protein